MKQKTLAKKGTVSGTGLFLGKPARVEFSPADENTGITFFKNGVRLGVIGKDPLWNLTEDTARCSAIGPAQNRILTVEHLLAAITGFGVSNISVDVTGDEVPAADGSAEPFVRLFKSLGLKEQLSENAVYRVREPLFFHEPAKAIAVYPAHRFEISFVMDYDHPYLRDQKADFCVTPGIFESQIAPARTFCTEEEAEELKNRGLGLGGTKENNIVVCRDGSHVKDLRFKDECVRHKVLDVIGDLGLLGFPLLGKVVAVRSGHLLNRRLVEAIRRQKENHD